MGKKHLKCQCCGDQDPLVRQLNPEFAEMSAMFSVEFQVRAKIATYGWTSIGVDNGDRSWVYTVGLAALGLPELARHPIKADDRTEQSMLLGRVASEVVRVPKMFGPLLVPGVVLDMVPGVPDGYLVCDGSYLEDGVSMANKLYGSEVRVLCLVPNSRR